MYNIASDLKNINISGISVHIGSQITSLKPFKKAYTIIYDMIEDLRNNGHKIDHVDLGGGLGVSYSAEEKYSNFQRICKSYPEYILVIQI